MIDAKGNTYIVKDYEKYRKIQLIQLEMLKEVDRICKKHNLQYYLSGGTLLGAVRHGGFIPWDDDLDIFLVRKDYDKLAQVMDKELDKRMFYQDWHKEKGYPYNFAKIRMNKTKFVQSELMQCDMHHGIYIDIFPLDNAPNDKSACLSHLKKVQRLKTLLAVSYMSFKKGGKYRSVLQCILIALVKTFFSQQQIHKKVEKEVLKYNFVECDNYAAKMSRFALKEVYPKSWFEKIEYVDFEGLKCPAPSEMDAMLTMLYGDYMTPPPSDEWGLNHPTDEIDFGDFYK